MTIEQKETPLGEPPVLTNNDLKEAFAEPVSKMREKVAHWNERVAAYRAKFGDEAELPVGVFHHHPVFPDICDVVKAIFPIAEDDEVEAWAKDTLKKIGRDPDGGMTYGGGPRSRLRAAIDASRRSAALAVERGNFAMAGLADQNVQLGEFLDLLIFGEGPVEELPASIGIREAHT
jgi:hypothetical protein